jgi:hypothetical protein
MKIRKERYIFLVGREEPSGVFKVDWVIVDTT